jgi:predicted PurR-regulated permease PerM
MNLSRTVEYAFFFGLLALAGYMVWRIMAPFVSALALAAIIVTICHPLYVRIRERMPKKNKSLAAFLSTMLVLTVIVIPVTLISFLVVREILDFYQDLGSGGLSIQDSIFALQHTIQSFAPGFEIDLTEQIRRSAQWLTSNLGAIFAGTISTIFVFFIALIGSFYFFRDGKEFLQLIIKASPLPDHEDEIIFDRMGRAVRSVATGTLFVAMIQGTLVAIGFTLFDIERSILWGSIAALGALVPGIGTTIVTAPAIVYLFFVGEVFNAVGLLIWSIVIVGLVDNLIGPYLLSRGNNLHPFIILISVLGGISLFGPVGFIIGPVVVTLFLVLLEIYNQYIIQEKQITEADDLNVGEI